MKTIKKQKVDFSFIPKSNDARLLYILRDFSGKELDHEAWDRLKMDEEDSPETAIMKSFALHHFLLYRALIRGEATSDHLKATLELNEKFLLTCRRDGQLPCWCKMNETLGKLVTLGASASPICRLVL